MGTTLHLARIWFILRGRLGGQQVPSPIEFTAQVVRSKYFRFDQQIHFTILWERWSRRLRCHKTVKVSQLLRLNYEMRSLAILWRKILYPYTLQKRNARLALLCSNALRVSKKFWSFLKALFSEKGTLIFSFTKPRGRFRDLLQSSIVQHSPVFLPKKQSLDLVASPRMKLGPILVLDK